MDKIDKSEYCVCYYDEKYKPTMRRKSKSDATEYQPASGTKIAFEYALKSKRIIFNLAESEM